ncbi:hypothetical protein [Vibrio parahaemolyticus]|uniref:hypothetical protein n=1 Tax=Vibrio parahaemolyticus TaxID=670 RepID=UPI001362FC20|nr:hypothetical protein [Vibrio parahaemolyticus]
MQQGLTQVWIEYFNYMGNMSFVEKPQMGVASIMAKVFAVIKSDNDKLELTSWSSAKAFYEDGNSFADERFICIASTDDYKERGMYASEKVYIDPDTPMDRNDYRIPATQEQVDAHNMLHRALNNHFKGKVFEQPYY